MHIAQVIDAMHWGGAEKWILSFSEAAKSRGLDITIISLEPFSENSPYHAQLESQGSKVFELSIPTLYNFTAMPGLLRIFKTEHFDLVQTHLAHANILGTLMGKLMSIPTVATLHSTHPGAAGHHRVRSVLERIMLRYISSEIVAVGKGVAEAHRFRLTGKSIKVIPNAVEPGMNLKAWEREAVRVELAGDPRRTILMAVGRLIPLKGYSALFTVFAQVKRVHTEAILVIAGDGRLRSDLESQASSLGIRQDVHFLGFRNDIRRLLAAADIFVNCSDWEGLSIAMLEAMAAGLPVLATRVGEAPFLLDDGRGILIPAQDPEALKKALMDLLDKPGTWHEMGKSARSFVDSNYAINPWMDRIMEVYAKAYRSVSRQKKWGFA
jgi:glycosyltransferase involved in cell wall biosynthesis